LNKPQATTALGCARAAPRQSGRRGAPRAGPRWRSRSKRYAFAARVPARCPCGRVPCRHGRRVSLLQCCAASPLVACPRRSALPTCGQGGGPPWHHFASAARSRAAPLHVSALSPAGGVSRPTGARCSLPRLETSQPVDLRDCSPRERAHCSCPPTSPDAVAGVCQQIADNDSSVTRVDLSNQAAYQVRTQACHQGARALHLRAATGHEPRPMCQCSLHQT
jgi:hypothetical protein